MIFDSVNYLRLSNAFLLTLFTAPPYHRSDTAPLTTLPLIINTPQLTPTSPPSLLPRFPPNPLKPPLSPNSDISILIPYSPHIPIPNQAQCPPP